MLAKLLTVFRVPELRRKIVLTVVLLAVYRLGFHITLPFVDHETVGKAVSNAANGRSGIGGLLQVVSVFSASDLQNGSVFGLGIMPYITASIVFQLLATVYPPLEQLQKEGESGRRRLNEYTLVNHSRNLHSCHLQLDCSATTGDIVTCLSLNCGSDFVRMELSLIPGQIPGSDILDRGETCAS